MSKKHIILSKEEVKKVARLAKLELTEKEIATFGKELEIILEYFESLKEIDVSQINPIFQTTGQTNVFRQKDTNIPLSPENALENASGVEKGYFKVGRILPKD